MERVPYQELSPQVLASYHKYRSRLGLYMGESEAQLFQEIKTAADTGESEAQFDLALLYCGIFLGSDDFTNLEKGLDCFVQLQELEESVQEDPYLVISAETALLKIDAENSKFPDRVANDFGRVICKQALARHFGIGCIKSSQKAKLLLNQLKKIQPHYFHLFHSIIAIVEKNPRNISVLTGMSDSAFQLWFKGKRCELLNKHSEALDCYTKAAGLNAALVGMAPVRQACFLEKWPEALEATLRYRDALIANGQHDEAASLEEDINQLAVMPMQPSPKQEHQRQRPKKGKGGRRGRKRRKPSLQRSKATNQHSSQKSELHTSTGATAIAGSPSQSEDEHCSDSEETVKDTTNIVETGTTVSTEASSEKIAITTPDGPQTERQAINKELVRINHLIRTKRYLQADACLKKLQNFPTDLHKAKTMQVKAWLHNCRAGDPFPFKKGSRQSNL